MLNTRLRRLTAKHCVWWCLVGILLTAIQPFLAVHFRRDGWEDEPGFRIRGASQTQFEADDRADHAKDLETTLFVPTAASIDLPAALEHGLAGLMALVLLLLPLTVTLTRVVETRQRIQPERVPPTSGAPPPTLLWRGRPPETAPPHPL